MKLIKIICLITFIFSPIQVSSGEITPKEVAEKVFHRDRGNNSVSKSQMVLLDSRGKKRARIFENKRMMRNQLEKQIIRFISPADIKGTSFLTIEKEGWDTEQFLFLPALRRTRRIVTSQKDQRFVNSDFTYEDMERHPVDDYTYELKGSEKINGLDCFVLESVPKPGVKSQYSKTTGLIHKESFVPLFIKFYGKNQALIKKYQVLKLDKVQGFWTEMIVSMEDLKKKHKTYLKMSEIKYNTNLDESEISRKKMEYY